MADSLNSQAVEEMISNIQVEPSANLEHLKQDCVSSDESSIEVTSSVKESTQPESTALASVQDIIYPTRGYYEYYYPGSPCFDASSGELDGEGYYACTGQLETRYPVIADNGSLIYVVPGYQPIYTPYSHCLPVPPSGVDGQSVGQHAYSPIPVLLPSAPGYFSIPLPYENFSPSSYSWDPSVVANCCTEAPEIPGPKSNLASSNHTHLKTKSSASADLSNEQETKNYYSGVPANGCSNDYLKQSNKVQQKGPAFCYDVLQGYSPATMFTSFNQGIGGLLYPRKPINIKSNGRSWGGSEKLKTRSKVGSERNHSPRPASAKGSPLAGCNHDESLPSDVNGKNTSTNSIIRKDQYNLPDFATEHDHAYFFVIKSYSEDDIHKSIKYNVWASTPNGNKKLDSAYKEAQKIMEDNGHKYPVFLFFSVNASGQFCGVAEMIGQVDYNRNMDFWQQDKWDGSFPVKWHIIKDVPNPQLRHIILENNEHKAVTNSRDTQEVKIPQGCEMLNIFKNCVSKTSILDDFNFYEGRQKVILEKRIRSSMSRLDNSQKSDELSTAKIVN